MSNPSTFTEASLYGAQKSLIQNLLITRLPLITTDRIMPVFEADLKKYGNNAYPFCYLRVEDLSIDRTKINTKTAARRGTSTNLESIGDSIITKNYQFPCELALTFKYVENDFRRLLGFIELFTMLNAMQGFNFTVKLPNVTSWQAELYSEENRVQIPETHIDSPESPAQFNLDIRMTLKTKIGRTREVPLANPDRFQINVISKKTGDHLATYNTGDE